MPPSSSEERGAAWRAALRLLSFRDRSQQELAQRLRRRGFRAPVVARVVQELVTRGLVDDRAFALQRARTLVQNRHLSPRRVRGELRDRGVAEEIIEVTIQEVFEGLDEEGTARAAAARRLKALAHLSPPVAERRLAGYLLRRGFLPETVHRVVTTLMQEHGRPTPDR